MLLAGNGVNNVGEPRENSKSRKIRITILACLLLIPVLTFLETRVFQLGEIRFPVSGNVLVFVLININVLLLLLMVFLVLRNLVKLVYERQQLLLGTRLRTRLVISFVSLSLIPTVLLFFIALQFVATSMDYWFNSTVEQSLEESLNIAKNIYQQARERVKFHGDAISGQLEGQLELAPVRYDLEVFLQNRLVARNLDGLELISDQRQVVAIAASGRLGGQELPEIPPEILRVAIEERHGQMTIQPVAAGELVRSIVALGRSGEENRSPYVLVTTYLVPREQLNRMHLISKGIEGYRQLMLLKNPIKTSLLVMLLIVTLLILFSATWFGFYVAQGLTRPIGKLAEATRRVAEGDLDFELQKESDDEMGMLVDSFNRMTRDLATSNRQLATANLALQESNLELDKRRQYTETILQNVAAGVISFDENSRITTINRFAGDLLHIRQDFSLGRDYRKTLPPGQLAVLEMLFHELAGSGRKSIQKPVRLEVDNETYSLLVNLTKLEDEQGRDLGVVMVFDNLTQLEKAQRMAAWREVARRIAHEVKNPLTPIQLSAQRLRKKYLELLGDDGEVFDLCTRTIVNQVDELKRLVSEFSSFARMPSVKIAVNDLPEMVREVMALYREAHKHLTFDFSETSAVPPFLFDREQLQRVLVNLLDNAVAVLQEGGRIEVAIFLDRRQEAVFIEVRDNGPGVSNEDKQRLFEPYFSTKKSGTGLGLAIASTIVADHNGYIRVRDNEPAGVVFIVELPFRA